MPGVRGRYGGIEVGSHGLAPVVDPVQEGRLGARSVDPGEPAALVAQEAVEPALGIVVAARDLAAVIDAERRCQRLSVGDLDRGVATTVQQEAGELAARAVACRRSAGQRRHQRRQDESCNDAQPSATTKIRILCQSHADLLP